MISKALPVGLICLLLTASTVVASPQYPGGFGGNGGSSNGGSSNNGGSSFGPGSDGGSQFAPTSTVNTVIISHAVLAALAWAFFMPTGAILLRLNIQSPIILRLHALCQIFAYLMYVVAVGMGIWIIRQAPSQADLFSDPHPKLGLAILAVGLFQPLWGLIHHRIFKSRAAAWKAGRSTQKPGRTAWGRVHLWIGRFLITVAIVNGGLGLRLAGKNPTVSATTTKNHAIVYGVLAGIMWLVYVIITAMFEFRKARETPAGTREERYALKQGGPPAYSESRESLDQR